jgi:hypothetical protein
VFWGNLLRSKRWGVQAEECQIEVDGCVCLLVQLVKARKEWQAEWGRYRWGIMCAFVCVHVRVRVYGPWKGASLLRIPESTVPLLWKPHDLAQYCYCLFVMFCRKIYDFCHLFLQVTVFATAICSTSCCSFHSLLLYECFSSLLCPSQDNRM